MDLRQEAFAILFNLFNLHYLHLATVCVWQYPNSTKATVEFYPTFSLTLFPNARWSSARRHGSHGSHGPCGPWCRFFWNLLGTQAMWSKQTFWRPVRSILTGHLVYPRFWFSPIKKHPESLRQKRSGWTRSSNLQWKVALFLNWTETSLCSLAEKPTKISTTCYLACICSYFPSWPAASTPTLRHDALLQPSFGVTGLQSWLQGFCGSLHGFQILLTFFVSESIIVALSIYINIYIYIIYLYIIYIYNMWVS